MNFHINLEGILNYMKLQNVYYLPIKAFLRALITSVDVLHSWSVPNFGVKMNACLVRLNQINLTVDKFGIYFRSCYEIFGIQHGFITIPLIAIFKENFLYFLSLKKIKFQFLIKN
jgi:cytochrome c oxidase subunit 2